MSKNQMRPIHPGEVLREEYLVPMSMTPNALAAALRLTAARINEIVREERGVSPETALRLARCLGTTAEFWLNLQMAYELRKAELQFGTVVKEEVRPLRSVQNSTSKNM